MTRSKTLDLKVNNLVKLTIALLLFEKPRHGYELFSEVEKRAGTKIGPSQVYPFLHALEKNGLVSSASSVGCRGKKCLSLTAKGRGFVKDCLERFGGMLEIAAEAKVRPCRHCNCRVYGEGHSETIRGRKLYFCCEHCAKSYKEHGH